MQHTYYSERKVIDFMSLSDGGKNESVFTKNIIEMQPRPLYMVISLFEPSYTPQWLLSWPMSNQEKVWPVQAYFEDKAKTKPVLIIYQINQSLS